MNSTLRGPVVWIALVVVMVLIWSVAGQFQAGDNSVSFTEFVRWVDAGQVESIVLTGNEITGILTGGDRFLTYAPPQYEGLVNRLVERDVTVTAKEAANSSWATLLYAWAPILLIIGFLVFFMRQVQSGGNNVLSLRKSPAKRSLIQKKVTFKDVAGVEEPKEELHEIIEFLKEPQKFQKLGGRLPKGVLLMGPPGTGKTLLARAVAGEARRYRGIPGARLFRHAPCIVFIDEIDAVGRHRGAGLGGGHDEREQTLNQLLVEMDGFESNNSVILGGHQP